MTVVCTSLSCHHQPPISSAAPPSRVRCHHHRRPTHQAFNTSAISPASISATVRSCLGEKQMTWHLPRAGSARNRDAAPLAGGGGGAAISCSSTAEKSFSNT